MPWKEARIRQKVKTGIIIAEKSVHEQKKLFQTCFCIKIVIYLSKILLAQCLKIMVILTEFDICLKQIFVNQCLNKYVDFQTGSSFRIFQMKL